MEYITVNELLQRLNEYVENGNGDIPVLFMIDPDQPYGKNIMQPLLGVKAISITNVATLECQNAVGLFNVNIFDEQEEGT